MNILYYGFRGGPSIPFIGWPLIAIGAGFIIFSFICWIHDVITGVDFLGGSAISILAIIVGIFALADTRVPIVKATINNEASWVEIAKDYKYLGREGDIYIFEALNKTAKEWEPKVNEMEP